MLYHSGVYLGPCQTYTVGLLEKTVNDLTINYFRKKKFNLKNVWQGPTQVSAIQLNKLRNITSFSFVIDGSSLARPTLSLKYFRKMIISVIRLVISFTESLTY